MRIEMPILQRQGGRDDPRRQRLDRPIAQLAVNRSPHLAEETGLPVAQQKSRRRRLQPGVEQGDEDDGDAGELHGRHDSDESLEGEAAAVDTPQPVAIEAE